MKTKLKAVIFDLDGVLCYTDEYHYRAWKQVTDRLGIPFDRKTNGLLRGLGRAESLEVILRESGKEMSGEEKAAVAAEKNRIYRESLSLLTEADLAPGVRETLPALRRRGLLLAVGSSSKNAPLILEKLDLRRYFDAAADGSAVARAKPDPEVFLLAASLLGVSPAEALVVEDGMAGMEAAAAGGFPSAGIGAAAKHPRAAFRLAGLSDLLRLPA